MSSSSMLYLTLRELSAAWRDEDNEDFLSMAHCLQDDLRSIGCAPLAFDSAAPVELTTGARLGIAYIIRGSRYDSIAIRPRVPMQYGATYLEFSPGLSWSKFLEHLERHVPESSKHDETLQVISGAKLALAKFGGGFKGCTGIANGAIKAVGPRRIKRGRTMNEPTIQFPVTGPKCGGDTLLTRPLAVVAAALNMVDRSENGTWCDDVAGQVTFP